RPPHTSLLSSFSTPLHSSLPSPLLHSFPTRRSSDLTPAGTPTNSIGLPSIFTLSVSQFKPISRRRAIFSKTPDNPYSQSQTDMTDRKSTRLNSSHGSISYAVFCLKKKTEIEKSYAEN